MNANIEIPEKKIAEFCRWKITEFGLFGSVFRDDFRPESDIDVLVSFNADARWTLFDLVKMEDGYLAGYLTVRWIWWSKKLLNGVQITNVEEISCKAPR